MPSSAAVASPPQSPAFPGPSLDERDMLDRLRLAGLLTRADLSRGTGVCAHQREHAATWARAVRASRTCPWPGRPNSGGIAKTQNAGTGPAFCDHITHQPVDQ